MQVLADVFGAPVYCLSHSGSAALGAASRAMDGLERSVVTFELTAGANLQMFRKSTPNILPNGAVEICRPRKEATDIYASLEPHLAKLEQSHLNQN